MNKLFKVYLPVVVKIALLKYFSFLYDYLKISPHFAALNITDNCCFKCITCNQWKNYTHNELSTREWSDVLSQLKEIGIKGISLTGGEPFMRQDIFDIILHAASLDLNVGVITNGYLLNRQKIERVIKSGVKTFSISIDGVGNSFDKIRGIKGAYDKVVNNCKIIAEYKNKNIINADMYFTLMKDTLNTYRQVFRLAEGIGLPIVVNLLDYTPYFFKQATNNKEDLWIDERNYSELKEFQKFIVNKKEDACKFTYHTYTEIDYFERYFKDPLQRYIPCIVSQKRIGIDSQGNVYGGCWSMGSFGNLKEKTLKEIINSPKYKKAHKNMFFKRCPGCSCGYSTNLRYYFPLLMREGMFRISQRMRERIYRPQNGLGKERNSSK